MVDIPRVPKPPSRLYLLLVQLGILGTTLGTLASPQEASTTGTQESVNDYMA